MAYPSGLRLYLRLCATHYWRGMRKDCEEYAVNSSAAQIENAKFKPPKYLHPVPKGNRPFVEWSVDCIVLTPPDKQGRQIAVVAVDSFTKWVEIGVLSDHSSQTLA